MGPIYPKTTQAEPNPHSPGTGAEKPRSLTPPLPWLREHPHGAVRAGWVLQGINQTHTAGVLVRPELSPAGQGAKVWSPQIPRDHHDLIAEISGSLHRPDPAAPPGSLSPPLVCSGAVSRAGSTFWAARHNLSEFSCIWAFAALILEELCAAPFPCRNGRLRDRKILTQQLAVDICCPL